MFITFQFANMVYIFLNYTTKNWNLEEKSFTFVKNFYSQQKNKCQNCNVLCCFLY